MTRLNNVQLTTNEPEGHWTKEQWQAIHARGAHILVSAAAGAGKTAVLVERIIQRILDPHDSIDVDRMLVVTFTEAAAAQMRERIGQRLHESVQDDSRSEQEKRRLRRQLTLLDKAAIQTLHGFCHQLLRRYFYLVDIDPLFRVLDAEEATLLQWETLERVLDVEYDRHSDTASFYQLIDAYRDARGDDTLRTILLELHAYVSSLPEPEAWYERVLAFYDIDESTDLHDLPWVPIIIERIIQQLHQAYGFMEKARTLTSHAVGCPKMDKILESELHFIHQLLQTASGHSWHELYAVFEPKPQFKTLRFPKEFEDELIKGEIRKARDKAKDIVAYIRKTYFQHDPEQELTLLREVAPHIHEILRLLQTFEAAYQRKKRKRAVVDFQDLERYAWYILQHDADDEIATPRDELRSVFHEVLVDEYQDINPLQDAILQHVSRPATAEQPNLFMVGDVKQSIYRFRLADPSLFMDRMTRFTSHEQLLTNKYGTVDAVDGVRIDLKANFRSRSHVVDAVNYVFRQIMTPDVGELTYDEQAELVAQAHYSETDDGGNKVEFHLIESDASRVPAGQSEENEPAQLSDDGMQQAAFYSSLENEAMVIADIVHRMLERGDVVYDRSQDTMRPVQPKDIVILLRSTKGRANAFVEALRVFDIPAHAELGTGFFWAVEVELMMAVLRLLDNPRQDIPLAAVLRAPWIDLTTEQLARLRIEHPQGDLYDAVLNAAQTFDDALGDTLQTFLQQLSAWRTVARRAPLADLIEHIYNETNYTAYVQGLPGGRQRLENLVALQERASRFDGFTQGGLTRFLRFVDSLQAVDGDLGEAPILGEGDNVVRIMSIHKSKGLQFPVVIMANAGKAFNLSDSRGRILYHGDLGIAAQWTNIDHGLRAKTIAQHAIAQQRRKDALAEELRVLYVALTRAQERLLIVGSVQDVSEQVATWAQATDTEGWALPDAMVGTARHALDWLGPAIMRHASAETLRELATKASGMVYGVRDHTVFADPAQWSVHLWNPQGLLSLRRKIQQDILQAPAQQEVDWQQLAQGSPLGRSIDEQLARELERNLSINYPYAASTKRPAKMSVTLLAREMYDKTFNEESAPWSYNSRQGEPFVTGLRRPRFAEDSQAPTAAERGTALHTLLYHLDLGEMMTKQYIESVADSLVMNEIITASERDTLDILAVEHFFASPLGQRLSQAAQHNNVWQEWVFTVKVPDKHIQQYVDDAQLTANGKDNVIVQGTLDILWREDDAFYIVDYKTDRRGDAATLRQRYAPQMNLYALAVQRVVGVMPKMGYLVHLRSTSQVYEVEPKMPFSGKSSAGQ